VLSPRLSAILEMLSPCNTLGDIGSDHALLIAEAVSQGKAGRGIAVEINRAPFEQSLRTVRERQLQDKVDVRLGDGLGPLTVGEVDALCIAGMGGGTMVEILAAGQDKLSSVRQMVLQPNVDAAALRHYLMRLGFRISDERLIEDGMYIYQVMKTELGSETIPYSHLELEYGRHNLVRKNVLLKKLLARDISHWQKVLAELGNAYAPAAIRRREEIERWVMTLEGGQENDNL